MAFGDEIVGELRRAGVERGGLVALAIAPDGTGAMVAATAAAAPLAVRAGDVGEAVRRVDDELRPRWVWWSNDTAAALIRLGVRVATCWDVAAVQRLLVGGWRTDPASTWAELHALPLAGVPTVGPLDLFSVAGPDGGADDEVAVRPDGHLDAEWVAGSWTTTAERVARWAGLALDAAVLQHERLAAMHDHPAAPATARSESTAEMLAAELAFDGLPMDRIAAEALVADLVGPRPRTDADEAEQRRRRDAAVLRHAAPGADFDLRNPSQVRSLLRSVGIEVPDTRAWRLRELRAAHPVVEALLTWRKAERTATTFGYSWLDQHLGGDGRLRGEWSGSDGAAGRMTASAGLHNMPAELRSAVVAEPGHVFVRADLGQIEPRVLAAVSGDAMLARATADDDMYAPVAKQLGVDRATAKVAVLGAMYGQTTGHGAQALRRLEAAYPVAMKYLVDADLAGQAGVDLRTYGGRRIRMGSTSGLDIAERDARSRAAAQGRYGRNAMVQGAAAELFKVWAVTVRARAQPYDAHIVLCLHDELLVHVPEVHGAEVARLLDACLAEAAHRWAPSNAARFVAETSVIRRWSDAKG